LVKYLILNDNPMDNIIQGNPTKGFFIEMITRDISIKDAINNNIVGTKKSFGLGITIFRLSSLRKIFL